MRTLAGAVRLGGRRATWRAAEWCPWGCRPACVRSCLDRSRGRCTGRVPCRSWRNASRPCHVLPGVRGAISGPSRLRCEPRRARDASSRARCPRKIDRRLGKTDRARPTGQETEARPTGKGRLGRRRREGRPGKGRLGDWARPTAAEERLRKHLGGLRGRPRRLVAAQHRTTTAAGSPDRLLSRELVLCRPFRGWATRFDLRRRTRSGRGDLHR